MYLAFEKWKAFKTKDENKYIGSSIYMGSRQEFFLRLKDTVANKFIDEGREKYITHK